MTDVRRLCKNTRNKINKYVAPDTNKSRSYETDISNIYICNSVKHV